jgi:hypothetical protein
MKTSWLTPACFALAMGGCYTGAQSDGGAADEGTGEGGESADGSGESGEGESGDNVDPAGCNEMPPPRASLLRMSKTNYVNALQDVFGADAVARAELAIDGLPSTKMGVFATELAPPTYAEVASYVNIATQLAFELTNDDADLASLRACLTDVPAGADAASDACVSSFIDDYGRLMLRRPLTDTDRTRLRADFEVGGAESVNEGIATLLTSLMLDPDFLYFVEVNGEEVEPGVVELTAHEKAARLARVLWDSVPDEELLAAAEAGLDDDMLREQVDRMLEDDRARAAIGRFYGDWLELEKLPYPSESLFPDAAARDAVRADMEDELLAFVESVTFDRDGTYADLLLDRTAFVSTAELADLYGVAQGESTLPENERAGVLTRAAWLATTEIRGSNAGHLIKRGAKLGEFLCRALPLPDPDNFPQEDPADPATNPDQTIRERFLDATTEPQCAGCHVQLDGFGAPFGHYGGAGQFIATEEVETEAGEVFDLEIDTKSSIALDDAQVEIADALALSQQLAASPAAAECMAEQLTRNIVARPLESEDECLAASGALALAPEDGEPQSIREAIVRIVTSSHFTKVSVP